MVDAGDLSSENAPRTLPYIHIDYYYYETTHNIIQCENGTSVLLISSQKVRSN